MLSDEDSFDEESADLLPSDRPVPSLRRRFALAFLSCGLLVAVAVYTGKSRNGQMIDRASLNDLSQKFTMNRETCEEDDPWHIGETGLKRPHSLSCWDVRPNQTEVVKCTAWSGDQFCRCPDELPCIFDALPNQTTRCVHERVYVHSGFPKREERYCHNLETFNQWKAQHVVALSGDGPAENGENWLGCLFNSYYDWYGGKCRRKVRYIGELCWFGWGSKDGNCANSTASEYSTVCLQQNKSSVDGVCMPTEFLKQRFQG